MSLFTVSEIEERRFGRDVVLPGIGQTVQQTASGDWPTVAGRPNLQAAHQRRAVSSPGDLVHRSLYGGGLVARVENPDTDVVRSLLTTSLQNNALRDPRIESAEVRITEDQFRAGRVIVDMIVLPLGDDRGESVQFGTEV